MGSQLAHENMIDFASSSKSNLGLRSIQDKIKEWVELNRDILNNARSAVYVLNDLLNFDKVETGSLNLVYTVIPIWNLVGRTFREFKFSAASKNINFTIDCSALLPEGKEKECDVEKKSVSSMLPPDVREQKVVGDDERIIQILRHFFSNAIKFTPDGGKTLFACSSYFRTWYPLTHIFPLFSSIL
jgi:signal transduction histidine kinase